METKYKDFVELSNKIGWNSVEQPVPSVEEALKAVQANDELKIATWWRFCKTPTTEQERKAFIHISEYYKKMVAEYDKKAQVVEIKKKEVTNGNPISN